MRKTLSLLFILCTSLFSQNFTLSNGWQLLGAIEDLNTSVFDGSCVDFVWGYDNSNPSAPQWRVHIANGKSYQIPSNIGLLDVLKRGEGFWVMSSGECDVESVETVTEETFKFTNDWLNGKTLYYVGYSDFGYDDIGMKWNMGAMSFTQTEVIWQEFDTPDSDLHDFNYSITSEGWISFLPASEDGTDTIKSVYITEEYIRVCIDYTCDSTDPMEQEYFFFDFQKARAFRDAKNAELSVNNTDKKFTYDMIAGKTFYFAADRSLVNFMAQFSNDSVVFSGANEEIDGNYTFTIDGNGSLLFNNSDIVFNYLYQTNDYIEGIHTNTPSSFEDDTGWFETTYGVSVSTFENNATKLKDWFLENGLWETTITADGKINKYGDKKFDGYWYIKDNIFYFAYPDDNYLDFKAYKVENDKLLKQTDAPYSETVRLYYDQAKRDAWLNTLIKVK